MLSLLSKGALQPYAGMIKTGFTVVVTAAVVGLTAWVLHDWSMGRADARHAKALETQKETLNGECQKDKHLTEETSRAYQNQLSDLRSQLATVKRVQPNRCVPTITRAASGRDDATANPQLPYPHGVFTDDLYDFAADAEQIGRQLDACQGFIQKTWESRGQN